QNAFVQRHHQLGGSVEVHVGADRASLSGIGEEPVEELADAAEAKVLTLLDALGLGRFAQELNADTRERYQLIGEVAEEVVHGFAAFVVHRSGPPKELVQIGQSLLGASVTERQEEVFLGGVIGVDSAHGETTLPDHVVHGGGVVALTGKASHSGIEDLAT